MSLKWAGHKIKITQIALDQKNQRKNTYSKETDFDIKGIKEMGVGERGGQVRCWTQEGQRRKGEGQEVMGYGGYSSEEFKRFA